MLFILQLCCSNLNYIFCDREHVIYRDQQSEQYRHAHTLALVASHFVQAKTSTAVCEIHIPKFTHVLWFSNIFPIITPIRLITSRGQENGGIRVGFHGQKATVLTSRACTHSLVLPVIFLK